MDKTAFEYLIFLGSIRECSEITATDSYLRLFAGSDSEVTIYDKTDPLPKITSVKLVDFRKSVCKSTDYRIFVTVF